MSNYLNFQLQSEDDVKNWIMIQLGYPLVHVEITDEQLTSNINDAIEEFTKYVTEEREYIGLDLEDYQTSGFTLPNNVTSVFALEESNIYGSTTGGVNTLFSVQNTMWNAGMLPIPSSGNKGSWIDYELAMSYVDLMQRMTAAKFYYEYNERSKLLVLTPNPSDKNMKGIICIGANIIRPDDQHFGESWVKRYALSLSKIMVGSVRTKYPGTQLLGGGLIDNTLKPEGLNEKVSLLQELKQTFRFVTFFVG